MSKSKHRILKYAVTIEYDAEDQIFVARCPELPGCNSFGDSPTKAAKNIQEAIELYIEQLEAEGKDIPQPLSEQKFSGKIPLRIDPLDHRDVALAAKRRGMSVNKFVAAAIKKQIRSA